MSSAYVVPLTDLDRRDVELAGGKGANLGELVRAGFGVPPGFVLTTRLYRDALSSAGVEASADGAGASGPDPARIRETIEAMTIPADLASQILDACRELGEGPVAVRSSATAEDLPGAAFAGQQETFLNVIGPEAVLTAVRGCWASLWAERAVSYRARLAYAGIPEIAVVVQRMIPSDFAGVLFTANPVTGVRDEVVIEASPGLGEAVVSGMVTPEHVVVDARGRIRERRPGRREVVIRAQASGGVAREEGGQHESGELPSRVLLELAGVGVRIGRHFGRPQDIEWGYAEGRLSVLQARPLTALPPAPVRANRIQRQGGAICAELLPTRPYPLDVTAWTIPGWFTILARMAEIPAVDIDVQRMFREEDGVVTELLPPEPRPTWRTLTTPWRVRPQVRRFDPARWTCDPRLLSYQRRLEELRGRQPDRLSWQKLMAVPGEVLDLLHDFVDIRIDYLPGAASHLVRLRILLGVLGLSSSFWPLLSGQPTRTLAANDALHAVAEQIRRDPEWAAAFRDQTGEELAARVAESDSFAPLRAAIGAWLTAYGHRETTSAALISAPTWEDDPLLLLGNLRGLVAHPAAPVADRDQAVQAERDIVRRPRVRLTGSGDRIRRSAEAARAAMVFREDSHFHALRVRPVLRRALLEAGHRLAEQGVLNEPDDVFHLRLAELQQVKDPAALDPDQRVALQELVRRRGVRRAEFGEAPLISPATLFPGVQRPSADALASGTPGGGGRATGPVRIIREPSEFGRLAPGDVLVCPYTNPAWTPLFQVAAAVVADSGSFGSHAAIVAREYGIPAVMGTGNGTRVLPDAMSVTVDGQRGDVVAADREDEHG